MKRALLCLLSSGALARVVLDVSPIQKVIQLLEDNKVKVQQNLATEEKEMAEYSEYCDDESTEKGYAIKTAVRKIADLTAKMNDFDAQISSLGDEVKMTSQVIAQKEKQLDDAEGVRATGKANFQGNEKELLTSIDELEGAIAEIRKSSPASLVQVRGAVRGPSRKAQGPSVKAALLALGRLIDATWVSSDSRKQLQGLIQTTNRAAASVESAESSGDDLKLKAPEAAAYESATTGITKTLEEMKEKAEDSLSEVRTGEMRDQHEHDMMAQSLTDGMEAGKEKLATTKANLEEATEGMGAAKNELAETQKNKAADEEFLATLTHDCSCAADEWATRQADAKAEMIAIDKAKEILADRVKVFVQTGRVAAVAARKGDDVDGASAPAIDTVRASLLAKLRGLSSKYGSFMLMEMVNAAAADPMEKVRGLIENMISKLVNEANQEATQKGFCDEEKAKSETEKTDKTMRMDKLKSRLDSAVSKKAELSDAVKELEAEIAALDKGQAEATKLRHESSAANAKAMADYKEAADAVTQATMVLKEYYEGVSLVQRQSLSAASAAPKFGSAKSDAASSILSILEMCGEDFTRMYMELQQSEAEDANAYQKMSEETTRSRAAKLAEAKGAMSEIKSLDVAIKDHQEDFSVTSQELDAVMAYLDKLKPQCESQAMSYEEKKSRREAEIEGLKEALNILGA